MTSLLVAGLIALLFGMARTAKQMSDKGKIGKDNAKAIVAVQDFVGTGDISLPVGSRLLAIAADQGRLYLTIEGEAGKMILIVDPNNGEELGRLLLKFDGDQ